MKKHLIIVLTLGLLISQNIFADSPLTSTAFSKAYKDSKIVQLASQAEGKLNKELMDYLIDKKNPIELKVALINELSWDFNGKNNSELLSEYLKKNKNINKASADILICYAYLKALDNYFEVDEAITYAQKLKLRIRKKLYNKYRQSSK